MLKSIYFVVLFLLCAIHIAHAQTEFKNEAEVSNAKQQVHRSKKDGEKVKLLLKLARWYVQQKEDSPAILESERYVIQSLNISNEIKYLPGIASAYLLLSEICQVRHNYSKGGVYAGLAAELFKSLGDANQTGEAYVMLWSNRSLNGLPYKERIPILKEAAIAFHKANNKKREADCYKESGDLYQIISQFVPALNDLRNALELYQQSGYDRLQGIYDLLGSVYILMGNYNDGIKYGLMAVKTAEAVGDSSLSLCTYYNRLGVAYVKLNDMEHAKKYLDHSLTIAKKYNDLEGILNVTYNLAFVLLWMEKPREGLDMMNSLMKKYPRIAKERAPEIACFMIPAYQYLKLYNKASVYCAVLEDTINADPDNIPLVSIGLGKLISFYIETGNLSKAAVYAKNFGKFSEKEGMEGFRQSYHIFQFRVDSAMGNYMSAIRHYQSYARIKDSILDETKSMQINQLNVLYETERKDNDILLLTKGSELQQSNLKHVTLIRNITLGGVVLLIVILSLLLNGFRRKQRTNRILQSQQDEIGHKNHALQKLVTEKEWLVKEIHHRVKNNLHMVVGLLASQTEFLKGGEALAAITDSQNRVYAMSLIHQKLYQTEELSSTDMPSYIFDLTEYLNCSFAQASDISFRLNITEVEFSLVYSVPIGLIINEAVTNAIKYAFPNGKGIIEIGLQHTDASGYILYIQDDGVGLPADFNFRECSSLGLMLMEGLSTDIEGTFHISSGEGTRVEIRFVDEALRNELH